MNWLFLLNHIAECAELYFYTYHLYPHVLKKRYELLAFFFTYILLFWIYIFFNNYNLNIFCNTLFVMFLLFRSTTAGILGSAKHALINMLIIILSELIFDIPVLLFHIDTVFAYPSTKVLLIAIISYNVIRIPLFLLMIHYEKRILVLSGGSTSLFTVIILLLCTLSLVGIENLGFLSILNSSQIPWVYAILISILLTGIASLIIRLRYEKELTEKERLRSLIQQTEDEKNYNHMIQQQDEEQKILIHDIRNHFLTIRDFLDKNDYTKASQHLSEILNSPAITGGVPITNNYSLSLILARYKKLCAEQAIHLSTDIKWVDVSFLTSGDVTSLFCNLLDNAMESAATCDQREIHLRMVFVKASDALQIVLVNSCESTPLKTSDGTYRTGKADTKHHGFGLQSIRRVINKYHGEYQSYYDDEAKEFHTIILIYPEVASDEPGYL